VGEHVERDDRRTPSIREGSDRKPYEVPVRWLLLTSSRQAAGTAPPSFTANLLEEPDLTPEKDFDIKWSAGSLYSGGADTVSASSSALRSVTVLVIEPDSNGYANLPSKIDGFVYLRVFQSNGVAPRGCRCGSSRD
jgi:hypothetical protein